MFPESLTGSGRREGQAPPLQCHGERGIFLSVQRSLQLVVCVRCLFRELTFKQESANETCLSSAGFAGRYAGDCSAGARGATTRNGENDAESRRYRARFHASQQ